MQVSSSQPCLLTTSLLGQRYLSDCPVVIVLCSPLLSLVSVYCVFCFALFCSFEGVNIGVSVTFGEFTDAVNNEFYGGEVLAL